MANETPKPTMDGIRPTRSVDGVAGGPVAPVQPQAQPQSAPVRAERTQAVPTAPPMPTPVQRPAQPIPQPQPAVTPNPAVPVPEGPVPVKAKKGRLKRVIVFVIGLIIVVAALGGIYWVYLSFYA